MPGENTYLQGENNWISKYANYTGSPAENRSYHWKINY